MLLTILVGKDLISIAAYKLQKATITEKFCENKDDVALKCEGKCFLTKLLVPMQGDDEEKAIISLIPDLKFTLQTDGDLIIPNQNSETISFILLRKLSDYLPDIDAPPWNV